MMLQVSLVFESIADELRHDPTVMQGFNAAEWPPVYNEHSITQSCLEAGHDWPVPLGIYTDGVRYQSPTSSGCDSMTGFWDN